MAANSEPITLAALFVHWRNLPHQRAAVAQLEAELKAEGWTKAMDRRRPWYLTWASTSAAPAVDWLAPAFQLIRSFEGCHLQAYLCPAGVPTIGWGNTRILNRPVVLSDRITRAQADRMLEDTVETQIVPTLARTVPHWREMRGHQRCALVSFAFNLGWGFYGSSGFATISAALKDWRWADVPAAMLLYRNPGSRFEEGLRRRRIAEGALWAQGPS
jgi:GH24 family phage-related lysozyme (muramidase)